jgi:hypothetical protein
MFYSSNDHPNTADAKKIIYEIICISLLLIAAGEFVARGPLRAIHESTKINDFLSPYIQSKAWSKGFDPYSPQSLVKLWPSDAGHFSFLEEEAANGTLVSREGIPTAYPLTSLVLISPLALLPWHIAYGIWLTLILGLFVGMLFALVDLSGLALTDLRTILLIAFVLALAPFHTGIVTANISVIAAEIGVISFWCTTKDYDKATAVLLAISLGLKPQIGLCFFCYYALRRRWRICGFAFAATMAMTFLGIFRLAINRTPWVQNYLTNNHYLFVAGHLGSFTTINPTRFGLINLQVALYPLVNSMTAANVIAMLMGIILFVVWATAMIRSDDSQNLLAISAIAVISLLPIYHRFYDAVLLVLPITWALVNFHAPRMAGIATLVLIAPFLFPGGTILEVLQTRGHIPQFLSNHWWWEAFVLPHQVWALLALAIVLLYEMVCSQERSIPQYPSASF